ncbi:phage portal protein [Listeria kieliensis]
MNDIKFLKGTRFHENANTTFFMAEIDLENIDFQSKDFIEQLKRFIRRHENEQLPRLLELKRYYLGDNNINYRANKTDEDAADNRIASDFGKYITIFEQGYMLGKPVKYQNENETVLEEIKNFAIENNEEYHNILIKTDLSIYGRAYELVYNSNDSEDIKVKLARLDPQQTFLVYDDTIEKNSLFAVRYYSLDYEDNKHRDFAEVYTKDAVYYYKNDNQETQFGLRYVDTEQHYFNGVPVNEYSNNEDRTGDYENVLDAIDAYDLSQSELANFQQDSVDAMLVLQGNPFTGKDEPTFNEQGDINPNSALGTLKALKRARMLILDDNPNPEGAQPSAYYLKKEYDAAGAEEYKKRLVSDILRFTFTPDTTDQNFSGVQSGESMKYKLMASDNKRVTQERLFAKGLMRRLRLAVNIWGIKGNDSTKYDEINKTNIVFSPNIPQNTNELITNVKNVYGIVSDETTLELLKQFTGVDAEEELKRLEEQESSNAEKYQSQFNFQTDTTSEEEQNNVGVADDAETE